MAWKNPETQEVTASASAGPANLGTCSALQVENPDTVVGVLLYYDSSRVTGAEFGIKGNTGTYLLGKKASGKKISVTSDEASFIGFYGIETESKINILGLITQNLACSDTDIPSGGSGSRSYDANQEEDDKEKKQMTMIILASIAGGIFLFFCCVWGCMCRKKNPKEE